MNRADARQLSVPHEGSALGSLKHTPKARHSWGRPSVSQTPSSTTLARVHRKEKSERSDKNAPEKSNLGAVLSEITEFNEGITSTFVPQYSELEQKVNASLDNFQTQIEKLQALHEQATRLFEQFQQQETAARQQLDAEISVLQRWETPRDKIKAMQEKIKKLREALSSGKERLARIDKELSAKETEERHARTQLHAVNGTLAFAAFLIAALVYLFFFRR